MTRNELITKEQMIALFVETLAIDKIEENDDFFELGGNSINAALLLYKIFKVTNISLSLVDVIENRTPLNIYNLVNAQKATKTSFDYTLDDSIFCVPYPQRHIWLAEKMDDMGANYIVTFKISLKSKEKISYNKLKKSIFETFENNTVYRIKIKLADDKLIAFKSANCITIIDETPDNSFLDSEVEEIVKKTTLNIEEGINGKVIIKSDEILFLLHHAVVDQASIPLFWNEVIERYYNTYSSRCINYYSCFENNIVSKHYLEGLDFWKNEFKDFHLAQIKMNECPVNVGIRRTINLEKNKTARLSEKHVIAFFLLLFYLSLQECDLQSSDEFIVGIPYTNRTNAIQAATQGFFVNMIPTRLKLGNMNFESQIEYVLKYLEKISKFQDISYEDIINGIKFNDYKEKKDFLRYAFVYQSEMKLRGFTEDESLRMKEYHIGVPMFDITIYINNTDTFYEVMLETNKILNEKDIDTFFVRFTNLYDILSNKL